MDAEDLRELVGAMREQRRGNRMASREAALDRGIVAERMGEQAVSLGRAGRRLEQAWQMLVAQEARVRACSSDIPQTIRDDYRHALAVARQARWELVVQREAMGLRNHRDIDELFPVPAPGRALRLS